jgi:putative transposase
VSITMEASFCIAALEEALARHGRPEIFNTDQGSQFTCAMCRALLALPLTFCGGATEAAA